MTSLAFSRRELLTATAGAAATAIIPATAAEEQSLGDLAAAKGLLYGASFAVHMLDQDGGAQYAAMYKRDCRSITSELELKMHSIRPKADVIEFGPGDRLVGVAEDNGFAVRGHTLIWNDALPEWVRRLGPGEVEHLLEAHIETTMDRYRGRIGCWDVVNEPIGPWDHLPGNLRTGVFLDALGEDYIARSFTIARRVDKEAVLVLNEAATEPSDEEGQTFRDSLLALLRRLKDKGTPIDAIGLECHLDSRRPYDFPRFGAFVAELADMGFKIHITELDVYDAALPSAIKERDRLVAKMYRGLLDAVLPIKAVNTVVNWQMADHTSWHYGAAVERKARLPRPLIYDSSYRRKPAWYAMAEAFESAPPR